MYEVPEVEEVLPEEAGMEAAPDDGPKEYDYKLPSLDATWSVLDTEPGMDDRMEHGGEETL
jgi:hypothetical protein